jgi:hypothetical protein
MARVERKLLEYAAAQVLVPMVKLDDEGKGIGTEDLSSFIGCDGESVRVCRGDFEVSMAPGSKLERRAAARWFCVLAITANHLCIHVGIA